MKKTIFYTTLLLSMLAALVLISHSESENPQLAGDYTLPSMLTVKAPDGLQDYINANDLIGFVDYGGKTYYVSKVTHLLNTKPELTISGTKRYFNSDYSLKTGLMDEDGTQRYYLMGARTSGWIDIDGDGTKEAYFLSANGNRVTESRTIGGKMYDCNSGVLTLREGLRLENDKYYFYSAGKKQGGFIEIDGKTFYFLKSTYDMVTSDTKTIGGYLRTFNEDHSINPIDGWQKVGDKTYFYQNGVRNTGFYSDGGNIYYFIKSDERYGEMASGWMTINGRIYYFYRYGTEKYGRMATGSLTISNVPYTFNSNGTINKGFIADVSGQVRYYYQSKELHGWYEIGGNVYYFNSEFGYMLKGTQTIAGTEYTFTQNGVLVSPEYTGATVIGGDSSYGETFDGSGGGWGSIVF